MRGKPKERCKCKTKGWSENGSKWRKESLHGMEGSTEWADVNEWNSKQNARKGVCRGTVEIEWWKGGLV